MTDDGFVALSPPNWTHQRAAAIVLSTMQLRSARRLQLSIDPVLFPHRKIAVAWNGATWTLRLTPNEQGEFELRVSRGLRNLLRIDLPREVQFGERKEPGPYRLEGRVLYVTVPPVMRAPADPRDAIAAARQALPAPDFSGRRGR